MLYGKEKERGPCEVRDAAGPGGGSGIWEMILGGGDRGKSLGPRNPRAARGARAHTRSSAAIEAFWSLEQLSEWQPN